MNYNKKKSMTNNDWCTKIDYFDNNNRIINKRDSGNSSRSSRIFSIFRWFKRDENRSISIDSYDIHHHHHQHHSAHNSPELLRHTPSSITGSVDTLFSTTTANSFAFVPPSYYRQSEFKLACASPDTASYKKRIRQRDKLRQLERYITLQEKYHLYGSGTLPRSVDRINEFPDELKESILFTSVESPTDSRNSTFSRKKRKAPQPPNRETSISDKSLPTTLLNSNENHIELDIKQHRRAFSEPVKYGKVFCHVKGKRKAPPPPQQSSTTTSGDQTLSLNRKKRPAPQPPPQIVNKIKDTHQVSIDNTEDLKLETASNASTVDIDSTDIVLATDTLRLERGILKSNKMDIAQIELNKFNTATTASTSSSSVSPPVSPRPWYKRQSTNKEQYQVTKHKDNKRKSEDCWLFESGFPRRIQSVHGDNKFNIFSKIDNTTMNSKSNEDKRRSQISILTNISELDREAAEIIQKGKEREKALIASHDAMFYGDHVEEIQMNNVGNVGNLQTDDDSRTATTKELISLFNAITNVTKVTVNTSFFSKENLFKKENGNETRTSEANNEVNHERIKISEILLPKSTQSPNIVITENNNSSSSSSSSSSITNEQNVNKITKVTIEELDEYDAERNNSKAQAMYEAHRLTRHQSPSIPTITEVSEGSMKSSPASSWRSTTTTSESSETLTPNVHQQQFVKVAPLKQVIWICPRCTLENVRWRITCEACDMWRPIPCEFKEQSNSKVKNIIQLPILKIDENIDKTIENKSILDSIDVENVIDKTIDKKSIQLQPLPPIPDDNQSEDSQAEEIRKARLAFFNKNIEKSIKECQTAKEENQINKKTIEYEENKSKLREMLKEMKHSLPKRTKSNEVDTKIVPETLGAISKIHKFVNDNKTTNVNNNNKEVPIKYDDNETAEAYLVESETIVEEIHYRKQPEKVSSSVQTSAHIRPIINEVSKTTTTTTSSTQPKEVIVPITVEEYRIKDGILYTSISKKAKRIGVGTFQLMKPKDFANIEAIKTDHVYANVRKNNHLLTAIPSTSKEIPEPCLPTKRSPILPPKLGELEKLSLQLTKPFGVASFRAGLAPGKENNSMNTMAVNRLLKRLEMAIAGGQHELAATLARELAQMQISCSVTRQRAETPTSVIPVDLFVEDRTSHQGPISLRIRPSMTVLQLKLKMEREYEIPIRVQRWILGRQLANDDQATLESMGIDTPGMPIFLYLVTPGNEDTNEIVNEEIVEIVEEPTVVELSDEEIEEQPQQIVIEELKELPTAPVDEILETIKPNEQGWTCELCTLINSPTQLGCAACTSERPLNYQVPKGNKTDDASHMDLDEEKLDEARGIETKEKVDEVEDKQLNYQKLVDMIEKDDLIISVEAFECPICLLECEPMNGVVLRECLHVFCRLCLAQTVEFSEEAEVKCPFRDNNYTCDSVMLEREIKALVSGEIYEQHLAKSITLAENKIGNTFHCKTPDCKGWCIYEDNVNSFRCPVCTHNNCLTCQAVHEGLDCKQFQEQLNKDSDTNVESKRTKEMLQEMVDRGEAMNCPTCQVVLMKKWGCDWLKCSMCKTEICWITRGPRWGPNGKGDTSGGCQCGVNGVKCHPKCTYCH